MSEVTDELSACLVCLDNRNGELALCVRCKKLFHQFCCGHLGTRTHAGSRDPEAWRDGGDSGTSIRLLESGRKYAVCGLCLNWEYQRLQLLRTPVGVQRKPRRFSSDELVRIQHETSMLRAIQHNLIQDRQSLEVARQNLTSKRARFEYLEQRILDAAVKLDGLRRKWRELNRAKTQPCTQLDGSLMKRISRRTKPGYSLGTTKISLNMVLKLLDEVIVEGTELKKKMERDDRERVLVLESISELTKEIANLTERLESY